MVNAIARNLADSNLAPDIMSRDAVRTSVAFTLIEYAATPPQHYQHLSSVLTLRTPIRSYAVIGRMGLVLPEWRSR